MKIVQLATRACAGMHHRTSEITNKFTEHESVSISPPRGQVANFGTDLYLGTEAARETILAADFVFLHQGETKKCSRRQYPELLDLLGRPCALVAHSRPDFVDLSLACQHGAMTHCVVGQFQPRFYKGWHVIPNMLDLDHWEPGKRSPHRVSFSPYLAVKLHRDIFSIWEDKGYEETVRAIEDAKLRCELIEGVDPKFVPGLKGGCLFHVDECASGGWHLSTLEGMASGGVVFNNADEESVETFRKVSGFTGRLPFIRCELSVLSSRLNTWKRYGVASREYGDRARRWMETYWSPKDLWSRYFEPVLEGAFL